MNVLVMGVTGVGKTTIGNLIAAALRARYIEADDFHPQANLAKMRLGLPLDDDDRLPWLHAVGMALRVAGARGEPIVLACSALRESYRQVLRTYWPEHQVVWLHGLPSLIAARLNDRQGHFMPASLLSSQFAILEPPADAVAVSVEQPPQQIARQVLDQLSFRVPPRVQRLERGSARD